MPTLGDVVSGWEAGLFVNREAELKSFEEWLASGPLGPAILNVHGPGGVGKSALLSAFRRPAEMRGWQIALVDGRSVAPEPEALLAALGGGPLEDAVARLNRAGTLLMLDSFEELASLTRFLLDHLLPHLKVGVRVVVASRPPLPRLWHRDQAWHRLVRPLALAHLSMADARGYLERRGLTALSQVVDEILAATRGHPLGLSLAADLVDRHHLVTLASAPEWRLVLRMLVERLRESEDPSVRALLEAGALVREFDEAMLLAIGGQPAGSDAFARLCTLSVVRPSPHGLALHDDVRHILATDLRWRNPALYAQLRQRALAYYRERAAAAPLPEREHLLAERFFLWEDTLVQALLFGDEPSGDVWLDAGGPDDHAEVRAVWSSWLGRVGGDAPAAEFGPTGAQHLEVVLTCPGTRLRVARDEVGRVLGFTTLVPISRGAARVLDHNPMLAALVESVLGSAWWQKLPADPETSTLFAIVHLAYGHHRPVVTGAALLRGLVGSLARGGTYLCTSDAPLPRGLLTILGFEQLTRAGAEAAPGWLLDLSRTGVEPWVEALVSGRGAPRGLRSEDMERELQAVLAHWPDDQLLRHSRLWEAPPFALYEPEEQHAGNLRQLVEDALERACRVTDAEQQLALRALQLAYLKPGVSHEAAAERLSVSRATFYRLLRRGIQELARTLRTSGPGSASARPG